MNLLRRTIRKLIQENNIQHFEKLAVLLVNGNIADVNQAIEIAESMEYIEDVTYRTEDWSNKFRSRTQHQWHFQADPTFCEHIKQKWEKANFDKPVFNLSFEFDYPKKGCVNLTLRENK